MSEDSLRIEQLRQAMQWKGLNAGKIFPNDQLFPMGLDTIGQAASRMQRDNELLLALMDTQRRAVRRSRPVCLCVGFLVGVILCAIIGWIFGWIS